MELEENSAIFTVGDLIEKLKEFDPNLPVYLADWNEGYAKPNNSVASIINLVDGDSTKPPFVLIGGQDEGF